MINSQGNHHPENFQQVIEQYPQRSGAVMSATSLYFLVNAAAESSQLSRLRFLVLNEKCIPLCHRHL